jgi:hypothetical protein
MSLTSLEKQRELTWLIDALYKLNPSEFRPDGVSLESLPKVMITSEECSYKVTLTWDSAEVVLSISASEANELLRRQSPQLIDRVLHTHYHAKQFIRRPLFVELEKSPHIQAVLVTVISSSKLRCEPLMIFPWQSYHEFSCANSNVIEDAIQHNKMILASKVQVNIFPVGTLFARTK